MTGPGIVEVSPGDMHSMAGGFRNADWNAGKPPPVPGDGDWDGVQDWHDAVGDQNQQHELRHHDRADRVTAAANAYENMDGQNAQQINGIQANKPLDQGVAMQGIGSILQSLGGMGQAAAAAAAGVLNSGGTVLGQGAAAAANVGGQMAGQLTGAVAKNVGVGSAAPVGLAGGAGAGGDKDKGGAATEPASGAASPLPPGQGGESASLRHDGGYARPQDEQHDTAVQPAGMSGMGGLGGLAGGAPGSAGKAPTTRQIVYGAQRGNQEPEQPEPEPVVLPRVVVAPKGDNSDRADT
jgi:hypothetical protein